MKRLVAGRFAASVVGSGLQAITLLLIATKLGVSDFGVFGVVFALGTVGSTLLGFGFPARALRLAAEAAPPRAASTMALIRLLVVLLFAACLCGVAIGLPTVAAVIAVAGAITSIEIVTELAQNTLTGTRRIRIASVLLVGQRLLVLAVVVWSADTRSMGLSLVLAAVVVVATNLATVIRARPLTAGASRFIREGFGYWRANVASSLNALEQPIVTAASGSIVGGLYAVGARITAPINLLSQATIAVTAADLATTEPAKRNQLFEKVRRFTAMVASFGVLVSIPVGMALAWLLGEGYERAWIPVAACVVAGTLMGVNQAHQSMLFAMHMPGTAARCVLIGSLSGLAAAAGGAAMFGIVGASVAPVLAQAIMLALFIPAVRRAQQS